MIPDNITREHILQAIDQISQEGVPSKRTARKFVLCYQGNGYPPKYAVALANKYANKVLLSYDEFEGGRETNDFLRKKGFIVQRKGIPCL